MANGVPARHRQASGAGQTIGLLCVHDLANTVLSLESEVVGSIKVDVCVRLERAAVVRGVLCVDVFARRAHALAEGVACGGNVRNEDLEPAVSTPPRLRQSPFCGIDHSKAATRIMSLHINGRNPNALRRPSAGLPRVKPGAMPPTRAEIERCTFHRQVGYQHLYGHAAYLGTRNGASTTSAATTQGAGRSHCYFRSGNKSLMKRAPTAVSGIGAF
jgi:hypothetical protein